MNRDANEVLLSASYELVLAATEAEQDDKRKRLLRAAWWLVLAVSDLRRGMDEATVRRSVAYAIGSVELAYGGDRGPMPSIEDIAL